MSTPKNYRLSVSFTEEQRSRLVHLAAIRMMASKEPVPIVDLVNEAVEKLLNECLKVEEVAAASEQQ